MGITNYTKWMRENHSLAFKSFWLPFYDHLYIDVNYALHFSHFKATSESMILSQLQWFLESIILMAKPSTTITIASDSQAPMAKLLTQRERRQSFESETKENLSASPLLFTAGTKFMNSLESNLQNFIKKVLILYNIKINCLFHDAGEAELKLKYQMMQNIKQYPNDTHLMISNDADVIAMFATFDIKSMPNIFVCLNLGLNKNKDCEIVSLGKLLDCHTDKYGMSKTFGMDFTLMSIMMGNDYLPKIHFLTNDKIFDSYKKIVDFSQNSSLVKNDGLNCDALILLMNGIMSLTKPCYLTSFTLSDYNEALYKNYVEGLLWCLDMYKNGECKRYDYMYEDEDIPHPLGLIMYFKSSANMKLCFNESVFPPADIKLYPILVLPQNALDIVDSELRQFSNQCKMLYDREKCKTCNDIYKKIKMAPDDKLKEYRNEFKLHGGTHQKIIASDIIEIMKDYEIYSNNFN